MGKFQDLIDKRGYKIEPVKTIRVPTIEEYNEKKQQEQNATADVVDSLGVAQSAVTGGLLAGLPGINAAAMKPVIRASGPLDRAPALGKTNLTIGTEQQVRDRKQSRIDSMEEDRAALEMLEGEYGILANDALPEDQRGQYQAQYDSLRKKYGEDITAEKLYDIIAQEQAALDAEKDANLTAQNMEKIRSLPAEDYNTLLRYASARNQQITVGPNGQFSVPRLEIQTDPDVKALIAKYGKDTVNKLAETLGRSLTADAAAAYRQVGEEVGSALGFGAIPITVGTGILGTPANLLGIVNDRLNSTGQYSTADPNQAGGFLSTFTQGANQAAAQKAPEQLVNFVELLGQANPYANEMGMTANYRPQLYDATRGTKAGEIIDAVGSGAYQVVNTAADSIARAYLGGGLFGAGTTAAKATSLGLAGVKSFGDTYNDVSAKGGTPGQAMVLGIFNGGTEIATEYIPLDEWWKIAKNGSGSVVDALKAAARQGAMEMTQEEIGFLATTMAEYAVLREKSEYQVLKKDLIDSGISPEDAERMIWEEFGRQAAGVAVTSFFSGALSEAGAEAFHALMPGAVTQEQTEQTGQAPQTQQTPFIAAGNAPAQAQQTQKQETVPQAETVPQEQTPLQKAQDHYRQNGTVSNSLAEAILADSESVAVLQREAGLELGGTKAQNRAAVKAAVARLAGPAEVGRSASTDIAESIASDFAEDRTEAIQAAQEPQGDVNAAVDTALRGETYQRPQTAQEQVQMPAASEQVAEQEDAQADMEHGAVGAAEAGFTGKDEYYDLLDKYGEKPARAGDDQSGRLVQIPERDTQGRHVTDFTSNAAGAQVTSNEMAEAIEDLVVAGALGFDTQTNEETVRKAAEEVKKTGWAKTHKQVRDRAMAGKSQDGDIAKAMLLYAHYNKVDDIENASEMMVVLSTMANRAGKDLQLFAMFRKLTPEGKLMTIQKTIDRTVEQLNGKRGKRNQVDDIKVPPEMQKMYMELAEIAGDGRMAASYQAAREVGDHFDEDKALAAETAIADYKKWGPRRPDANVTTNDLVDRIGERVANNLNQTAREQNKSTEDILYEEIMRFVNDKVEQGGGRPKTAPQQNQNLRTLADYYRYQPFFQNAWDNARARVETMLQTLPDDDPRVDVIYGFLNDFMGSMIENDSPVMRTGDYSNPKSTVRRAAGEAAKMVGVRMENASQRTQQAKAEMRDVLTQNAASKAEAARRIADIAVKTMSLDGQAAQEMARDIVGAFYNDLAQRGAARVQQLLTPKVAKPKVVKSVAQQLAELYNMGGFNDAQTRQALMDTVFGEGSGVDIPDSMLETYVNAANEDLWKIEDDIYKWAGSQIKGTRADRWRAWRYMAMLGNVKTQLRNIAGNIAFMPMKAAKDAVAAAAESVVLGRKHQDQRTKAFLNLASQNDRDLIAWAKADAKSTPVQRAMQYSGNMGEDVSRNIIMENRRIFRTDGMEAVRKFVQAVPGAADMLFKSPYYANSLAGFLKARGYTAEQVKSGKVSSEVMAEARTYAINEAMKATFNDCNAFSDAIASLGRGNSKNPVGKVIGAALEGVLPFRRTPANIVVRFVEYSPVGLLTTAGKAIQQVRNGEFSAATMIDGLASSFTGTLLAVLGAAMAHGIFGFKLHGGIEDEDDKRRGVQSWSIEFSMDGETYTYTIDWMAPANLPLFFGAQLYEAFTEDAEETEGFSAFTKFIYACGTAFEPMLEMSFLSSLSDLIKGGYGSDGSNLASKIVQVAMSYFTQGIPSLARQLYQMTQENKMRTFANAEDPLLRGAQEAVSRIPFVGALAQTETLNAWGEEVSRGGIGRRFFDAFLSPGTLAEVDSSELEAEVKRLNGAQPDNVSPDLPDKTLTYTDKDGKKHEDYRLTEEEWSTMARVQGQTAKELLTEIVGSDAYAAMTDTQKAEVFSMVYDYAREKARGEAVEGYVPNYSDWMEALAEDGVLSIYRRAATSDISGGFTDWWTAENAGDREKGLEELEGGLAVYDGLSAADKAKAVNEATGRTKYLLLAHDNGMSTDKFLTAYEQYMRYDDLDISASDKDEKWSIYLQSQREKGIITKAQENVLRENMLYYSQFPGEAGKVDLLRESGLSSSEIYNVTHGIDLLRPIEGNTNVTPYQWYEVIAGSGLSDAETDAVMLAYMPDYDPNKKGSDKTELKYKDIRGRGYSPEEYVELYGVYRDGGGKKAIIDAINELPYVKSYQEAVLLYSIFEGDYYKK